MEKAKNGAGYGSENWLQQEEERVAGRMSRGSSIRVLVGKGKESSRELVSDDLSSLCKPRSRDSVLNQGGAGVGSC